MKKLLLGLGTALVVATPITAVVSCGSVPSSAAIFSFEDITTKDELIHFLVDNKTKDVVVELNGKTYSFTSTGELSPELEKTVDSYVKAKAIERKAAADKAAKEQAEREAEAKAKAAKELADKIEKAENARKDLLKTDIAKRIKELTNYDASTDVKDYVIPDSISIEKDGISFEITTSNVIKDESGGRITFDASIENNVLDSPREIKDIKLNGFEVNLDDEHKMALIQQELDDDPSFELADYHKTSSEITENDIHSHIQDIVTNDFSFVPTIENIKRTSGEVSLDITYKTSKPDGSDISATKTISFTGLVKDLDRANELQELANEWQDTYKYRSSSSDVIPISEDDPRISAGAFKVTKSVAKEVGLDLDVYRSFGKLVDDKFTDLSITINADTLKGLFAVKYNGVEAVVVKKPFDIETLEKHNFKVLSERRTFREGQKAVQLPNNFKLPKGLTELPAMSLSGYIIPKDFKLPDGLDYIDQGAFAGAEIAEGVKIPDTVTIVKEQAFEYAKVPASMSFPSGVDFLPRAVFRGATIADGYEMPDTLDNFDDSAFLFANIGKNFKFPAELNAIADNPFVETTFGEGLILPTHIKLMNLRDGSMGGIFSGAKLPSYIDISKIKIDSVFSNDPHDTLEEKIDLMFDGAKTTDHLVPNYVTHLREDILGDLSYREYSKRVLPKGFKIPNNIKYIDSRAFYKLNVSGLVIPDTVIEIGDEAFAAAALSESFRLPSHLEKIGFDAFYDKGFGTPVKFSSGFVIPDTVTSIGDGAFANVEFSSGFTIGSGITQLGYATFDGAKFADDFKLPLSIKKLIDEPFKNAKLPSGYNDGSKAMLTYAGHIDTKSYVHKFGFN